MRSHEVVLPEEVPRLRAAAAAVVAALVPFCLVGIDLADRTADRLVVPFVVSAVLVLLAAVAVSSLPTSPLARRLAFLGAALVFFALLASLIGLVLATDLDFARYLLRVVATAAAAWSTYVLWPVVQVDSGTSSGNRPQALSGSTSSTPSS
jgi:hypothetical protein